MAWWVDPFGYAFMRNALAAGLLTVIASSLVGTWVVLGLRPGIAHALMLALIALVVVASFRTVGTLLVFAFLVAPPATASLITRRVPALMAVAIAIGSATMLVGLLVSYHVGLATAPTIAGASVAIFFVTLAVRETADRIGARRPAVTV